MTLMTEFTVADARKRRHTVKRAVGRILLRKVTACAVAKGKHMGSKGRGGGRSRAASGGNTQAASTQSKARSRAAGEVDLAPRNGTEYKVLNQQESDKLVRDFRSQTTDLDVKRVLTGGVSGSWSPNTGIGSIGGERVYFETDYRQMKDGRSRVVVYAYDNASDSGNTRFATGRAWVELNSNPRNATVNTTGLNTTQSRAFQNALSSASLEENGISAWLNK